MAKQNCWEFLKCGREIGGAKAHELGICPAAVFTEADGYCGGKNGGRACMYIAGTFCCEVIPGTRREEWKNCENCNFYNLVRREEGAELSVLAFDKYVNEKKKKTS